LSAFFILLSFVHVLFLTWLQAREVSKKVSASCPAFPASVGLLLQTNCTNRVPTGGSAETQLVATEI